MSTNYKRKYGRSTTRAKTDDELYSIYKEQNLKSTSIAARYGASPYVGLKSKREFLIDLRNEINAAKMDGKNINKVNIAKKLATEDVYELSSKQVDVAYAGAKKYFEETGIDIRFNMLEVRAKGFRGTKYGKELSNANELMKKQGINNSRERSILLGELFFFSPESK